MNQWSAPVFRCFFWDPKKSWFMKKHIDLNSDLNSNTWSLDGFDGFDVPNKTCIEGKMLHTGEDFWWNLVRNVSQLGLCVFVKNQEQWDESHLQPMVLVYLPTFTLIFSPSSGAVNMYTSTMGCICEKIGVCVRSFHHPQMWDGGFGGLGSLRETHGSENEFFGGSKGVLETSGSHLDQHFGHPDSARSPMKNPHWWSPDQPVWWSFSQLEIMISSDTILELGWKLLQVEESSEHTVSKSSDEEVSTATRVVMNLGEIYPFKYPSSKTRDSHFFTKHIWHVKGYMFHHVPTSLGMVIW